uniref:Autophagy-related protein 9 n=2 Tax=Tetraselmis sp. GSL018 TaxID=582737 RepID=A0A061R0H4_9CHLO|mmetsp:Transcript_573/g.1293  ORF Transcript_573/g.1293 Transcript_573/m.1293 type:complete len:755 (+) Transcript_573:199-2463(+)
MELLDIPARGEYETLPSEPVPRDLSLDLEGAESYEVEAISNLDEFFTWIYRYYLEKGFCVMVVKRLLNVGATAFIGAFSGVLLLGVDWRGLHAPCVVERRCDIADVAFRESPLRDHPLWWTCAVLAFLGLLALYLAWAVVHMIEELRHAAEVRHFFRNRLGISDRLVATMSWPEVLQRVVLLQQHIRLCVVRDLTAHDICARIMRRDNFLIAMLNKGVLALNTPLPGLRRRVMLTKVVEWNLRYCLLDAMFDSSFRIRPEFKRNPRMLARRFQAMAVVNLLISPFLVAFLVIYFFMRNAEKFYHHPSSVAARSWSPYAKWCLREFNEVEHLLEHRLAASREAAVEYISQFPTPIAQQIARFVAFVSGSFAALVIFLASVNDVLMERHFAGHNLVWWGACLGVLLAVSRAVIGEGTPVFDPEDAMAKVVRHTHFMPRHWRGRAHTREVQEQFEGLFCFKAILFVEELASVFLAPYVLGVSLARCSEAITSFIRDNSINVAGLGDVCSAAQFDLERHGSRRYGAPAASTRAHRSRQGKMEKSLVTFASTYPFWEPESGPQRDLLGTLARCGPWRLDGSSGELLPGWSSLGPGSCLPARHKEQRHPHPALRSLSPGPAASGQSGSSSGSGSVPADRVGAARAPVGGTWPPADTATPWASCIDVAASQHTSLQLLYEASEEARLPQRDRFFSCLIDAEARSDARGRACPASCCLSPAASCCSSHPSSSAVSFGSAAAASLPRMGGGPSAAPARGVGSA